jgi:Flp pilus assembly protein TadG
MPDRYQPGRRTRSQRGNSLIELSLLIPWYFFLFAGAYDFGFYSYSLISLEEGTRVAALSASQNSTTAANSTAACTYVLGALQDLPNLNGVSCPASSSPLTVTAAYGASSGPDGGPETTVTVAYTTPQLIPIPGLLPGKLTLNKTIQMRIQ